MLSEDEDEGIEVYFEPESQRKPNRFTDDQVKELVKIADTSRLVKSILIPTLVMIGSVFGALAAIGVGFDAIVKHVRF